MAPRARSDRRRKIVEVARRRLTEFGYDATTIGDIASELGISKAAIAYYFPTKDRFLDEFVAPVLDELEAAVADSSASSERDPRAVLGAYLDVLIRHHELAVWIDTDPAVLRSPVYGPRIDELNAQVVSVITARSRRKADRLRALGVLGGLWRPARVSTTDDLAEHRDELVVAALDGYAAAG